MMNRRHMLICLLIIVGLLSFSLNAYASKCELPSSAAKVTVKQMGDKPIYEFTVTNNSDTPIYLFVIGVGAYHAIPVHGKYIPREVQSPEGWDGRRAFQENGGDYMRYLWTTKRWRAKDDTYAIKPGETVSGFKLVLKNPADIILSLPYSMTFRKWNCLHGIVEAVSEGETQVFKKGGKTLQQNLEETQLYMKGEKAFHQNLLESSVNYLWDYLKEYGDNGKFSDAALLYLGISFDGLTGESYATYEMILDKTEEDMREMLGKELYEDLRKESIERNIRMGSADMESDPDLVLSYLKRLYAEKLFLQKYGRFNRYKKSDLAWYPPIYTKDEYVKLLEIYPDSEWAGGAFLRLANIRPVIDRKSPIENFSLLEYEGFGSFVVLVQNCLELYKKYEISSGLDIALIRLNLLYPEAGHVDDIGELFDAVKAYEEILHVLPDGENSKEAAEILRDLKQRMKNEYNKKQNKKPGQLFMLSN